MRNDKLTKAIDKKEEEAARNGLRPHLGASLLGRKCPRYMFYVYRWAHDVKHSGRILRLFQRGNREESVFVRLLKNVGILVEDTDRQSGQQHSVSLLGGAIAGSLDGIIGQHGSQQQFAEIKLVGNGVVEFKTHGDASFRQLCKSSVRVAKMDHFIQMQIYMHLKKLRWALYCAVNKNTDETYFEFVEYQRFTAEQYLSRGIHVVQAIEPPRRIHEDSSYFDCKICDFKRICHDRKPPDKTCRTCKNIELILEEDKHSWFCHRYGANVPYEFSKTGCDDHEFDPNWKN